MTQETTLEEVLQQAQPFHPVVPFKADDQLLLLDFSENNPALTEEVFTDTLKFSHFVNSQLQTAHAKYGIGGYLENRVIYKRSDLFHAMAIDMSDDLETEPRTLHLGIDIWGKPYTPVMAPVDSLVHSFAFHTGFGDYGATIILCHRLEGQKFFTLYGHLSLNSIKNLQEGARIHRGDVFAEFGIPQENGSWPPHLHFQIIKDMEGMKGDYPGVCKNSEKEKYRTNCPDPDLILQMMPHATAQF